LSKDFKLWYQYGLEGGMAGNRMLQRKAVKQAR